MASGHVNAIVVGAGAGGGVVAKELSEAGLTVVLFERGPWPSYDDNSDDELISQRTTVLGNAFGPDDRRYRRVLVNDNGSTRIVAARRRSVLKTEPHSLPSEQGVAAIARRSVMATPPGRVPSATTSLLSRSSPRSVLTAVPNESGTPLVPARNVKESSNDH